MTLFKAKGYKDHCFSERKKDKPTVYFLFQIGICKDVVQKLLRQYLDMQNQYYSSEEEYRQFLLYQQQQQQQQGQYLPTGQHPNPTGHYPNQHQYPAYQLASTQGYPQAAGYEGYYQHAGGYVQGAPATTSAGGYGWPHSQQYDQNSQLAPQQGHSSRGPEIHAYIALPSTPQSTIDTYLAIVQLSESEDTSSGHSSQSSSKSRRAYSCKWPGCPKAAKGESFKSKDNARVHVHKHFGTDKLFQCVVCRQQFASEDAAKRHRDTTDSRAYTCAVCQNSFARKDYRDWHQSRCRK